VFGDHSLDGDARIVTELNRQVKPGQGFCQRVGGHGAAFLQDDNVIGKACHFIGT
jgi:hypothetical protein